MPFIRDSAVIKQFIRFIISGMVITVLGISLLYILTEVIHLWYLAASVVSFITIFVVGFSLQKFWAFQNKDMEVIHRQASFSLGMGILNFFLNTALMYLLVTMLAIHYSIAQLIVYGTLGMADFFVYKFFIFRA